MIPVYLYPRVLYALAKKETWNHPFMAWLATVFNGIPLDRQGSPAGALKRAEALLNSGGILVMAPEGTRSGNGALKKGKTGAAMLALHTGVPVYPIAISGTENFWSRFKKLKRTRVCMNAGDPVFTEKNNSSGSRDRQELTDSLMRKLAALLPENKRGYYSGESEYGSETNSN